MFFKEEFCKFASSLFIIKTSFLRFQDKFETLIYPVKNSFCLKGDARDSFFRVILEEIAFFMQKVNILGRYWLHFFAANLFGFMQLFDSRTHFG